MAYRIKLNIAITLITFPIVFACSLKRSTKFHATALTTMNSSIPPDSIDLRVLCAVGMRQVLLDILPKFEQVTKYRVVVNFNSSGEIMKWVNSDKPVDLIIIFRPAIEQLVASKRVIDSTIMNIAMSHIGVAVAKGALKPDISSPIAFKKAMLDAKSIACPDPAQGGASGTYITKMFEQLGIAETLKSKLVLSSTPEDEKAMPGYLVATGKADIAVHQMQELLAVPGIDIVGPLPDEIQATFVFTAAIPSNSKKMEASKALIRFLTTPGTKNIIKLKGMEPAGR